MEAFVEKEERSLQTRSLMSPKRLRPSIEGEATSPALITVSRLTPLVESPAASHLGCLGAPSNALSPGCLSQALITAIKCWDLLHAYEQLRSGKLLILFKFKFHILQTNFGLICRQMNKKNFVIFSFYKPKFMFFLPNLT